MTCRFQTGLHCLTDLPVVFQKAIVKNFNWIKNAYCFLDDKLTVCKETKDKHFKKCFNCLRCLDEGNLNQFN